MDLLLIGGVSGSGKNVALGALEDAGYYAINNLPPPLLVRTAEYLAQAGRQRVAIALDVKTGPGLAAASRATSRNCARPAGPCASSTSMRRPTPWSSASRRRGAGIRSRATRTR